ncbi:MAG: cytidylate kinase-like family protein, partial [Propionicimonas sp.]
MAVITVSRQLGSRGARLSRDLAKELGYTLVNKGLINAVIRKYGLVHLDAVYDHKPKVWDLFKENRVLTIEMMNQAIAAFAARGDVVILGRGGFKVLDNMGDVVNVFVKAPEEVRIARIAKRDQISAEEAAELIHADDAMRARFTRLFYSADWADESQFDLVIDTGTDSDESARAKVIAAMNALPPVSAVDRAAANISVDVVLT